MREHAYIHRQTINHTHPKHITQITILRAGAVTASQIQACLAANGVTGVDVRVLQRRVSKPGGGKEGESVLKEAEGPQVG